jgi:magnesium transporter
MVENIEVAQAAEALSAKGSVLDHLPMRDEENQLRHEFVEEITRAIRAADRPLLCGVVAELHEADLGDLIGALEADDRVTLVELTGTDFDFSALNEVDDSVREEILEELAHNSGRSAARIARVISSTNSWRSWFSSSRIGR